VENQVYGATLLRPLRIALALAVTVMIAGCGLEAPAGNGSVSMVLTRDFGAHRLDSATVPKVVGGATALGVLRRKYAVTVGAGSSVRAIDGVPAGGRNGRWALYLNGVAVGPRTRVHAGDRLWWDLEPSRSSPRAVVGSFPEPFTHGLGGKRFPTTLECAADVQAACRRVMEALGRHHVAASSQVLGAGSGQDSLTVVVATWRDIRPELAATVLARGPASSGVFAHFVGDRVVSLQLLDTRGAPATTLRSSAGLIAALRQPSAPPTWLILGTDVAGVNAAARALSPSGLRDRLALAISGAHELPVPR
jgi:hypothetical protein